MDLNPYEELFNPSSKKWKSRTPQTYQAMAVCLKDSGFLGEHYLIKESKCLKQLQRSTTQVREL